MSCKDRSCELERAQSKKSRWRQTSKIEQLNLNSVGCLVPVWVLFVLISMLAAFRGRVC